MTEKQKELAFQRWWTETMKKDLPLSGPKRLVLARKLQEAKNAYEDLKIEQERDVRLELSYAAAKAAWMVDR